MGVRDGFDAYHLADHAISERVREPGHQASTYRQVVPDAREQRCGGWHRFDHAQRPLDRVIETYTPAGVVLFVVVGGGVELDARFAAELDGCPVRARNRRRPSSSTDPAGTPGVG